MMPFGRPKIGSGCKPGAAAPENVCPSCDKPNAPFPAGVPRKCRYCRASMESPSKLPEPPHVGSAGKKDAVEQQFHTGGPVKAHLVDALADMMGMGPGHPEPKPSLDVPERIADKVNLNLIPVDAKWLAAMVFQHGAEKYDAFGWEDGSMTVDGHVQAAERHMDQWKAGAQNDAESGLPHLAHAMARIMIAVAKERRGHPSGHIQGCGLPERAA